MWRRKNLTPPGARQRVLDNREAFARVMLLLHEQHIDPDYWQDSPQGSPTSTPTMLMLLFCPVLFYPSFSRGQRREECRRRNNGDAPDQNASWQEKN
jgi:hypothetical protein